jgi:hypothetical protein
LETYIPISLKKLLSKHLNDVKSGKLSKSEAEAIIKQHTRYSSKTRQEIIEELSAHYDQELADTLSFFSML